jgi:hypothetical protein
VESWGEGGEGGTWHARRGWGSPAGGGGHTREQGEGIGS